MRHFAVFAIFLALPFSASAYTHHFVPNPGAIFFDGEVGMMTGKIEYKSGVDQEISAYQTILRGGYGISEAMALYADFTYQNQTYDTTGALVFKTETTGIKDFRVGLKGSWGGDFQLLYSGLLSIPGETTYKENFDSSPLTSSASTGRMALIPQVGFQWVLPTMKMGAMMSKDFFTGEGKVEQTTGGLVWTGDRSGGEYTITDIFIEGGLTETMLGGFVASYIDRAPIDDELRNGFSLQTNHEDSVSRWLYQIYTSFTINDDMRMIPAFTYWKENDKGISNQAIFMGTIALRMVF